MFMYTVCVRLVFQNGEQLANSIHHTSNNAVSVPFLKQFFSSSDNSVKIKTVNTEKEKTDFFFFFPHASQQYNIICYTKSLDYII